MSSRTNDLVLSVLETFSKGFSKSLQFYEPQLSDTGNDIAFNSKIVIIVLDHLLITYQVLSASPTFTLDYKFHEVKVMVDLFTALDLQFITVPSTQKKLSKYF